MKNWNQIFEHHDEDWSQELLSMTLDQLLDKLKEKGLDTEYQTVEDILKMHMMDQGKDSMPTWDEMKSRDKDTLLGGDWMDELDKITIFSDKEDSLGQDPDNRPEPSQYWKDKKAAQEKKKAPDAE